MKLRSLWAAVALLVATTAGAHAACPNAPTINMATDGNGNLCVTGTIANGPATAGVDDSASTATLGTADTIVRAADGVRFYLSIQVQTAGACVAYRFGNTASLTAGTSTLLGPGCSPAQTNTWTYEGTFVPNGALHMAANQANTVVNVVEH